VSHLILARHGNTFEPADKVVWVGARNDIALAKKGLEQADHFAKALAEEKVAISSVFCGPLKRTREFARIIAEKNGIKIPTVENRLDEIDYGSWSGLSDAEIEDKFGKDALTNWNDQGQWPEACDWARSASHITEQIIGFTAFLKQYLKSSQNVLAVTSNGRLKFFPKLIPGEFERRAADHSLKVATGNVCILRYQSQQDKFEVLAWNEDPAIALKLLHSNPIGSNL
jgi:broad specificity phosphatase PhoE